MVVIIDVRNDGIFPVCAGCIAFAEARVARLTVVNAQEIFICIDDFSLAVAVEIEDG